MPAAFFLCPMAGAGSKLDPLRAKYQAGLPADGIVAASSLCFSSTDDALLAIDAPQIYLDAIAADANCTLLATPATLPEPLTQAQVNAIQTFLENRGIPAQWVDTSDSRRDVLRGVAGMFLVSQRLEGRFGEGWKRRLISYGVTLATDWQSLPPAFQAELLDIAASFGFGNVAPPPAATLRQILRALGQRFNGTLMLLGGVAV